MSTVSGSVAVLLVLLVALAPGCATLGQVLDKRPDWCVKELETYSWASGPGGPFVTLDALSTTVPELGAVWPDLKARIDAAQTELARACAETPGQGGIAGVVAQAAALVSQALAVYTAFAGGRELDQVGEVVAGHQHRLAQLQQEIARETGQRAAPSDRGLVGLRGRP